MLTLGEYEKIAMKLIMSYGRRNGHIRVTDELIGRIIRFMAIADWKWRDGKSRLNRMKYRRMHGLYAIREYLKPQKINFSLLHSNIQAKDVAEENKKSSNKLYFLIKNSSLSKLEKLIIDQYLVTENISLIAENLGISYDKARRSYYSALSKMKRVANVE